MTDPLDKKTTDKKTTGKKPTALRTLFIGAALGSAATVGVPMAVNEAIVSYRNGEEARGIRMTVQDLYPARPGLPPRVITAIGIDYDIVDVPARGVRNADAIWREMRVGCTYDITAFGYRTRELGVNPVLMTARHYPTPECPALPARKMTP